jgi:hypothetical protein
MKNILLFIVLLTFSSFLFAQDLTNEEKQIIINNLDSSNILINYPAILQVESHLITEAIPKLESKAQNGDCTGIYLRLLQKLGSTHVQNLAHLAIDSSDKCDDPVETRYDCSKILIELGEYTTAQYIIEYYNAKTSKFLFDITLLPKIIENRPDLQQQAKQIIFDYAQNFRGSSFSRYLANAIITEKYPSEAAPILVNSFRNEPDDAARISSLWYLFVINYSELPSLMKERLLVEPISSYRRTIADSLLKQFGTIENYQFVKDYSTVEQDTIIKSLVESEIVEFIPNVPDSNQSKSELIDLLILTADNCYNINWLSDLAFSNELKNILTTAKTNLQNGDSLACRVRVKAFQDLVDNVYKDSLNTDARFVTIEGWKFLYWNAQYILDRLPEPPANPNLVVNLKNSLGNQIPASNVKYYEGNWKDAVNNGDGTFTVITTKPTVSIRVFYEYASQQVDNVPAQNNSYTFQTVNAAVQLKNSLGNLINAGTVQYYAGAWRSFGTTSNGVAYKELLPINYSFRMNYEYGSIDKQQNLSSDPTVVFQTVNATVQLKNSLGNLIDLGTVQYYAGAWRSFGTTSNGVAYKELLPINYSFRMTYEFVSKDKQQNLSTNPVVDFSTVLCSVKVSKTSDNQPINNADVKYYSGAWRNLGTTNTDGIAIKELLPANISFRATSGNVSLDKQQDISVNSLVEILLNIP